MQKGESNRYAWAVCLMAALFPFYSFIEMNFLNSLSPYLFDNASIKESELGILSSGYFYADALMLLPVGILLDRYRVKLLILFGLGLMLIGGIIFVLSNNFLLLFSARIISGSGHAFALLSCFRLVSQCFVPQKRARVIGLVITIALMGGLVAQAPLALFLQKFGLQITLWTNIWLGMSIFTLLLLLLPENKIVTKIQVPIKLWKGLKHSAKNKQNWFCGLYISLLGLPLTLLGAAWGTSYLSSSQHLSNIEASWVTTGVFLGTLIGSPLCGWISDCLQRRRAPIISGALLSVMLMLAILLLPNMPVIVLIVLFFLLSFFCSTQVIGYSIVSESNHMDINSTAMGLVNVIVMFISATSQLAFGWVWGSSLLHNFSSIFIVLFLAIGFLVSMAIKESLT